MICHRQFQASAFLVAVLLLCCLTTIAQTAPAPSAKPGTISGKVVNESGRPLPNVRISLKPMVSFELAIPEILNTTTDHEGKFEISGLKPVNYQVYAFLQGYTPLLRGPDDAQSVYKTGDSVTLVLTKGGVITGRVTNQAGEPIVGLRVRALMVNSVQRLQHLNYLIGNESQTDDRGIYRIYGLAAATYVVWAGGGGTNAFGGMYGEPDPFASDIPTYAPASTRDTAQEIVVHAGVETNNVDIQYRGGSGRAVSGSASGAKGDEPLGFNVMLVSVDGPQWAKSSFQNPGSKGFIFDGLDDGDYYLTAVAYRSTTEYLFSPTKQISVRGADITGVELVVQPLSSVSGRVLLEELKTSGCSDPQRPVFTETLIFPHTNGAASLRFPQSMEWGTVNADERGNVLLKNLPAGRYYFTTQHFAKEWYLKSLSLAPAETAKTGKPVDAARTWTTLKSGERLTGLTITFAQGAASLRGNIALNEGQTLPGSLYVYLVPAEKEYVDDLLRYYRAAVTTEGKVALNNVAPGRYFLLAQTATNESGSPLTSLRSPDQTAYRVKLRREAEDVKQEIELKPCQKVVDLKVRLGD